jgi:predicted DNA-binding transcriptional regulator YafY
MRRTERLLAIAEHLRARRTGVTAEDLAERFGVTVRTMYRDLASLREASLPIGAERGRGGGYALDRSYTLPPVNFTAREAAVLVSAAAWLERMRVMPFAATLQSATEKVRAALGASAQRELLTHLREMEYVGVPAQATAPEVRRAVEEAWFEQRPLVITYRGSDGVVTRRRVRVRKVVMDRGETRLNCDDLDKGAARQFLLHRIEKAHVERELAPRAGASRSD